MNWSCSARSQAFSPCTPRVGVYGSWTSGGEGQFLSRILKLRGCEHVNRVLFDFPDVIERAKKFLAKEGISDNRITFTMGNLPKDVPQLTEVDTIIVKNLFVIFTDDKIDQSLGKLS